MARDYGEDQESRSSELQEVRCPFVWSCVGAVHHHQRRSPAPRSKARSWWSFRRGIHAVARCSNLSSFLRRWGRRPQRHPQRSSSRRIRFFLQFSLRYARELDLFFPFYFGFRFEFFLLIRFVVFLFCVYIEFGIWLIFGNAVK